MYYNKGDIVVIHFPFSDLINAKKRPMVVLAQKGEDIIGCAITSNLDSEGVSIKDFAEGSLPFQSKIKHWQIHTFLKDLAIKKVAKITPQTYKELVNKINEMFVL